MVLSTGGVTLLLVVPPNVREPDRGVRPHLTLSRVEAQGSSGASEEGTPPRGRRSRVRHRNVPAIPLSGFGNGSRAPILHLEKFHASLVKAEAPGSGQE